MVPGDPLTPGWESVPGAKRIPFACTPNTEDIFGSRIFWSDFTHEMAFTREGLRQLACASGFSECRAVQGGVEGNMPGDRGRRYCRRRRNYHSRP
jgi:hypothetical protein